MVIEVEIADHRGVPEGGEISGARIACAHDGAFGSSCRVSRQRARDVGRLAVTPADGATESVDKYLCGLLLHLQREVIKTSVFYESHD
jgi:hypothetical protein